MGLLSALPLRFGVFFSTENGLGHIVTSDIGTEESEVASLAAVVLASKENSARRLTVFAIIVKSPICDGTKSGSVLSYQHHLIANVGHEWHRVTNKIGLLIVANCGLNSEFHFSPFH